MSKTTALRVQSSQTYTELRKKLGVVERAFIELHSTNKSNFIFNCKYGNNRYIDLYCEIIKSEDNIQRYQINFWKEGTTIERKNLVRLIIEGWDECVKMIVNFPENYKELLNEKNN